MDTKARIAAIMIVFTVTGWGDLSQSVEQVTTVERIHQTPVDSAIIDDSPRLVFHGATEAQAKKMLWAIDRFGDLQLELPSLDITFAEGCRERFGAWGRIQWDTIPWRVEVCTTAVYLHELAHAWDRWNLKDTDRSMYLDMRGLEAWQGSDIPWEERGKEDLAILVARVVGQGVDNYHSEDRATDLRDFAKITGVPVPDAGLADPTGSQPEAPQY